VHGHGFAGIAAEIQVQVRSGGETSGIRQGELWRRVANEKAEDLSPAFS